MAKKSFTNNPAIAFISSARPKTEEQPEVKQKEVKTKPAKPVTKPAKEKPASSQFILLRIPSRTIGSSSTKKTLYILTSGITRNCKRNCTSFCIL